MKLGERHSTSGSIKDQPPEGRRNVEVRFFCPGRAPGKVTAIGSVPNTSEQVSCQLLTFPRNEAKHLPGYSHRHDYSPIFDPAGSRHATMKLEIRFPFFRELSNRQIDPFPGRRGLK